MEGKTGDKLADLDTILVEELGEFGKFQLRTCALAAMIGLFASTGVSGYVLTTTRINTRCVILECEGIHRDWSPPWLANAIPAADGDSFDNCHRFGNTTDISQLNKPDDSCPKSLFDKNVLKPCKEYVYETKDTIVYEFGLACNEWARTLIGTIRTVGMLISLPVTGYISDRWGRRIAVCFNAFNSAWLGLVRYWATNYTFFIVSEFMEAVLGAGSYISAYILMMEFLGPKYRMCASAAINSFYSIGLILMGFTAWTLRYWRHLLLAFYTPQLLTILYFFWLPESVRWYLSKGRFAESETLLKKATKVNGRQLSDKSLKLLHHFAEEEAQKKALKNQSIKKEWLIVTVFKYKRVLLTCIVTPIWWIACMFIYYGLSINAVNMSGNRYLNFIAVASVEIPGHWFSIYLLTKMGRKPVLIFSLWCCAACQFAYVFMPPGLLELSLTVYLIAQFCIGVVIVVLYAYTAELYPTPERQILFSWTSTIGRIGGMIAPLTPAFGTEWFKELPFLMFGTIALLSSFLVYMTPETRGAKLPDTFEEAEALGH